MGRFTRWPCGDRHTELVSRGVIIYRGCTGNMNAKIGLLIAACIFTGSTYADPNKAVTDAIVDSVRTSPGAIARSAKMAAATWETVPPKSVKECMTVSGGEINPTFVRCRQGRQELVNYTLSGNREVLSERPIPGVK